MLGSVEQYLVRLSRRSPGLDLRHFAQDAPRVHDRGAKLSPKGLIDLQQTRIANRSRHVRVEVIHALPERSQVEFLEADVLFVLLSGIAARREQGRSHKYAKDADRNSRSKFQHMSHPRIQYMHNLGELTNIGLEALKVCAHRR